MATAYIDWSNDDCDWGVTHLNERNYSCPNSSNGLHDLDGGFCLECGRAVE